MLYVLYFIGAAELLLVMLEGLFPRWAAFLPLGGSHIAQVGVVSCLVLSIFELCHGVGALLSSAAAN